ncbi:MAG: DUF739 family protein [Ruminococcaceae bacterium]|nr:DUF739 family protein [Oscillospiraceae bacterium]
MTNTSKLKGRIAEKGHTLTSFSGAVGISRPCLRKRINGFADFKVSEIERICTVLNIAKAEIGDYFFVNEVPETETFA